MDLPSPPDGLSDGIFSLPLPDGKIRMVFVKKGKSIASADAGPFEAAGIAVDIFMATTFAHAKTGRPLRSFMEQPGSWHFLPVSSIGLGPCSMPEHECLILQFGEAMFGVAIPISKLRSLGEALMALAANRTKSQ
jgi:hypothetical protein